MATLDYSLPDLRAELTGLLAQIPAGQVTTYGILADALGSRSAARWVGEFLRAHEHTAACPCHRVVRKDGEIGLYLRDQSMADKEARLRREGVAITDGFVERCDEIAYRSFRSGRPLARLVDVQTWISRSVRLEPYGDTPALAAGLDVSYRGAGTAVGACAIVETQTGRLVWSTTHRQLVDLPYIPGLLAFRELPILLPLFDKARRQWPGLDLVFVDGNGILHPRGAGIAACFGVVAAVRTIGIAKSLLCGRVEAEAPGSSANVTVDDRRAGLVVRRSASSRPLFVSPGQDVGLVDAARLTRLFDHGHRLPEPLYWADRLSRIEAKTA